MATPLPATLLLPHECRLGSAWTCARSVAFGALCLATLALAALGCRRIAPVFVRTRWYMTNLSMLALSALQMALLAVECLVRSSSRVLVAAKYCRGVQVAASCLLYGKLACELSQRQSLYPTLLAPVVAATMLLMTLNAAQVVLSDDIDCHSVSWLVMSTTGVVLAASFAFPGRIVLDELKVASQQQKKLLGPASASRAATELEQSQEQLYVLLVCNAVSSSFQLAVDVYVTFGLEGRQSCDSMFFEDGAGALEQSVRLLVSVGSYLVPNWATIYVFYVLPRFQFATALDVSGIAMDDDGDNDDGSAAYELLLNEQEQELEVVTLRR
ncbi:hypothetical protein PybrP1_009589 [[Pythium] brassicae (nom. inval.)]|nr:hypothetical protein PybrP1_009589 [[Pythium] brassicae (nom. inval.)]